MPRPAGHRLNQDAWDDFVVSKGHTPTTVAELADIPRPTISALLGGYNRASVETAYRLANALGLRPGTLFPSLKPYYATLDTEPKAKAS